MKLGERLRRIRREHQLTLKDLKERADLSVPYLSDLERGVVNPSIETLKKVANAYNMSVSELLSDVEELGKPTQASYPEGFAKFLEDPDYRDELNEDWKNLLIGIKFRGQQPSSKREWVELYLNLRRIFSSRED